MTQNINCKKGRCVDSDSMSEKLAKVYDDSDVVDSIQHELIDDMIR